MTLLRRLALLLALEGVALVGLGVEYAVVSHDSSAALLAAGAAAVTGLVLLVLARAADRARRWARSPAVVLNVFPLPVGLTALQSGAVYVGLVLMLLPATVLYLFATPDLREVFRDRG